MSFDTFARNAADRTPRFAWAPGFQFEFYCELCKSPWRPSFQIDTVRNATGWAGTAAQFLVPGVAGSTLNMGVTFAGFSGIYERRQRAFEASLAETSRYFGQCSRCSSIICPRCYVPQAASCRWCASQPAQVQEQAAGFAPPPLQPPQQQPQFGPPPGQPEFRGASPAVPRSGQGRSPAAVDVCERCAAPRQSTPFCGQCGHRHPA